MPHAALRLAGTVNTNETPALNQGGGLQSSNLIRFFYDSNGVTLIQKLGGWTAFQIANGVAFPSTGGVARELHAWQDTNLIQHLAMGSGNDSPVGYSHIYISNQNQLVSTNGEMSPYQFADNAGSLILQVTAGSNGVLVTDNAITYPGGSPPNGYTTATSVYITTPISIGGIILFGSYAMQLQGPGLGPPPFAIFSVDLLGNPLPSISTGSTYEVPILTMAGNQVSVVFPYHGYAVGDTFPILNPVSLGGGKYLWGNFIVTQVSSSSAFAFTANVSGTLSSVPLLQTLIYSQTSVLASPIGSTYLRSADWTFDNWGGSLVICPTQNQTQNTLQYQPIYVWEPSSSSPQVNPSAPMVNDGFFVAMPQRQIIAWGSTENGIQDPLLICWCDVNNYNVWTPLPTNQAGNYRIPTGSRIVGAVQGPQQALVWTDIDVWAMQYIGPPYVYGFNKLGSGCGLIGRKAAAFAQGVAYWMGADQFYTLSANGVQPLPCPVWDTVYETLDRTNLYKIRVAVNSLFNEIQWFFPTIGVGENTNYVKYNYALGFWDIGQLARTAWIDQSVVGPPVGADPSALLLMQHETSNDGNGAAIAPMAQTGYMAVAEGDVKTFIDWVWPDMKWGNYRQPPDATVQLTFFVADYPGDIPTAYGPYSVTQFTEYFYTRFRGRLVSVGISSNDLGSFWRIGLIRYRFAVDGKI